MIEIISNDWF